MKDWFIKYWLETLFGIIVAFIIAWFKRLSSNVQAKNSEQEAIKLGVQALLRASIINDYNHYTDKKYCPIYARENMDALYMSYHALGGNGTVTGLMEKLKELPTEPETNLN